VEIQLDFGALLERGMQKKEQMKSFGFGNSLLAILVVDFFLPSAIVIRKVMLGITCSRKPVMKLSLYVMRICREIFIISASIG
jgi:hypothetical protein